MIGSLKKFLKTTTRNSSRRGYNVKIKEPKDSYVESFYNFDTDIQLRENYLNSFGSLRIGKILEDLDFIAGDVAYK